MSLPCSSVGIYDIFSIVGEVKMAELVKISSELMHHIEANPSKSIALEMSETTHMDSATIRMLVNLNKKMAGAGRQFCLLNPSDPVKSLLADTSLDNVFEILEGSEDLQKRATATMVETFAPFTEQTPEGLKKLRCKCPVCGSTETIGYLLDINAHEWKWNADEFFPVSLAPDSDAEIDVMGLLPVVCMDCFFVSTDLHHFHMIDTDGKTVMRSELEEEVKNLLSKSIKKRKSMMEIDVAVGDNFFLYPRDTIACYQAYLLAEACSRSLAINKHPHDPYIIGYYNYCALKYAAPEQKDALIDNCRTWLTQALSQEEFTDQLLRSRSFFVLLIVDLSLNKLKEASDLFKEYSKLIESMPADMNASTIDNPRFWYDQAKLVWEGQIEKESKIFKPE